MGDKFRAPKKKGFDQVKKANPFELMSHWIAPPFTVLDTRSGQWKDRKRYWAEKFGVQGGEGRDEDLTFSSTGFLGERIAASGGGTSIFDPVLCECCYRWWCPPGGHILDPFAGESTKGLVATNLGFNYTGVELRQEQVDANDVQAARLAQWLHHTPSWVQGDSSKLRRHIEPTGYDMIFTSPPYYDLEIYSQQDKDGSAFETYEMFMDWYRLIFKQAVAALSDNRFVVVKVGEVRNKKTGVYYNFLGDNISCFLDLGLHYYNEAVLVSPIGSLPVRTAHQFPGGRKLGKGHQNILVFWKGDPKKVKEVFSG